MQTIQLNKKQMANTRQIVQNSYLKYIITNPPIKSQSNWSALESTNTLFDYILDKYKPYTQRVGELEDDYKAPGPLQLLTYNNKEYPQIKQYCLGGIVAKGVLGNMVLYQE